MNGAMWPRIVGVSVLLFLVLSIPEVIEFATGEARLDALGVTVELAESVTLAAVIAAVTWLTFKHFEARRDRAALSFDLVQARAENVMWRDKSKTQMEGVRRAIADQFDTWRFTPAEKDIASLILKGCTHKQIAGLRRSSESTVRQHAQSIYRKSGLENRSELAAYFLDAILFAADETPPSKTP
jgi:DNA-binding NarL/FixJ family response regulator